MKRVFLFLLMCVGCGTWIYSYNTFTYTKQYQATVGVPFILDPIADIDFDLEKLYGMTGFLKENYNDSYSPTDFTYTVENHTTGGGALWQVYTITPQKVGTSIFHIKISEGASGWIVNGHTHWQGPGNVFDIQYTIYIVDVTKITIPASLSLRIGEEYTFSPVIEHNLAQATLTWSSNNASVATVDETGKVTAVSAGTTNITCTAQNGVSATCKVTVKPIYIESLTINETECLLNVGEKKNLEVTILPENASIKELTWFSSNEAVAIVDGNGNVTAIGSGYAQITAAATDGSGKKAYCVVTVEKNNKLTVTDVAQCNGGRGFMNVILTDEEIIMGFQFDLKLPAGVTVPKNESGTLMASLTGNAVNTHNISSSQVSGGLYRFVVTSSVGRPISSTTGDGLTIAIDVAEEMPVGTYEMTIKNIELTVKRGNGVYEDIHPKDNTAILTVSEAIPGDVNGDGRISVTDVISIISYIQEETPTQFLMKSADVNGDGNVSITDAVRVIDMILNQIDLGIH